MVYINDVGHFFRGWEVDIVEETAAKEGIRQFLFIVRRDNHDRTLLGFNNFLCFIHIELHFIEL